MSGNAVRLQAINNVEAYVPPAISFDPGRGAGRDLRRERLHEGRDAVCGCRSRCTSRWSRPSRRAPSSTRRSPTRCASAMKDWALSKGATHYAHVFYPMTGLTAEKHDSFLEPVVRRADAGRVRWQDPDPGRARRVQLPVGRPAQHLRGPRLHRLGRHQPGVHPGEPERQHAVHPDGVRVDDRRGAGLQDAAAAQPAGDGRRTPSAS